MSYISDKITRDQFLESVYDKSKSESSMDLAKTAINQFDAFCKDVYDKESVDVVLADLKKDVLETGSTDKVLILLNGFVQWLGKDHPHLKIGTGHKNSPFRPIRARMPSSIRAYFIQARNYVEDVVAFIILSKIMKYRLGGFVDHIFNFITF